MDFRCGLSVDFFWGGGILVSLWLVFVYFFFKYMKYFLSARFKKKKAGHKVLCNDINNVQMAAQPFFFCMDQNEPENFCTILTKRKTKTIFSIFIIHFISLRFSVCFSFFKAISFSCYFVHKNVFNFPSVHYLICLSVLVLLCYFSLTIIALLQTNMNHWWFIIKLPKWNQIQNAKKAQQCRSTELLAICLCMGITCCNAEFRELKHNCDSGQCKQNVILPTKLFKLATDKKLRKHWPRSPPPHCPDVASTSLAKEM